MSSRRSLRRRLRDAVTSLYRPSTLGVLAILLGAAVATPQVMRLTRELARQPIYLVEGGDVQITRPHEFVDPHFFRDALDAAGLEPPLSVVDPLLVSRLRLSLEESPWVASVDHLSATLSGGVRIALTYRRPAMMVQTGDGLFPVDEDAVLLPSRSFDRMDAGRFPMLRLFEGSPAAAVGGRWRDTRVLSAVQVVRALHPFGEDQTLWQRAELVELRPGDTTKTWEIWTAAGSRVIWGEADSDGVVEPATEQKIGKLESLLAQRRSLNAPAGPYRIDLRRWDVITLEPIAGVRR